MRLRTSSGQPQARKNTRKLRQLLQQCNPHLWLRFRLLRGSLSQLLQQHLWSPGLILPLGSPSNPLPESRRSPLPCLSRPLPKLPQPPLPQIPRRATLCRRRRTRISLLCNVPASTSKGAGTLDCWNCCRDPAQRHTLQSYEA